MKKLTLREENEALKAQIAAMPKVGRKMMFPNGRRVNLLLNEESIAKAAKIGNGNISVGIRSALDAMPD